MNASKMLRVVEASDPPFFRDDFVDRTVGGGLLQIDFLADTIVGPTEICKERPNKASMSDYEYCASFVFLTVNISGPKVLCTLAKALKCLYIINFCKCGVPNLAVFIKNFSPSTSCHLRHLLDF